MLEIGDINAKMGQVLYVNIDYKIIIHADIYL